MSLVDPIGSAVNNQKLNWYQIPYETNKLILRPVDSPIVHHYYNLYSGPHTQDWKCKAEHSRIQSRSMENGLFDFGKDTDMMKYSVEPWKIGEYWVWTLEYDYRLLDFGKYTGICNSLEPCEMETIGSGVCKRDYKGKATDIIAWNLEG
jgi:hypothetical protein